MGVKPEDYPASSQSLFQLTNIRGALVTMPHKVTTIGLVDEVTPTARIAGACNAILMRADGTLARRPVRRRRLRARRRAQGPRARRARGRWSSGNGGVGSAIAASLAAAGVGRDRSVRRRTRASAEALAERLREHYPELAVAHRIEGPGRATTWSSTRRRSA